MPFPLGPLLGVGAGIAGFLSDKKKNKRAKEQLELDRMLANKQISMADYLQSLSKLLMERGGDVTDPYGNVIGYDEASGTYKTPLRPGEIAVQDASDKEELARNTQDQEMRRGALQEAEQRRALAGGEATQGIRDISLFKQGIGALDPSQLAGSIRASRQAAINAGYDDAQATATKLGLRTGSSAVSDALAKLGRERAQAQIQGAGNPEIEGLQLADEMNRKRLGERVGLYDLYNTNANQVYDAAFQPSNAADKAFDKSLATRQLDLSQFNTAMGGTGAAASAVGSAAAGQRQGFNVAEQNRVHAPFANLLGGFGDIAGASKLNLAGLFGG